MDTNVDTRMPTHIFDMSVSMEGGFAIWDLRHYHDLLHNHLVRGGDCAQQQCGAHGCEDTIA